MSSSHRSVHTDNAKKEQIVTEFFAKSLHIILEARSPFVSSRNYSGDPTASSPSSSSSSSSSYKPRDKWFNLALHDCPAALENIDFWRQSNLEPMIVDVILVDPPLGHEPANLFPKGLFSTSSFVKEQEEYQLEKRHEKVIERWVVKYECRKSRDSTSGCKRSSTNLHVFYKKLLLLLRSLYSMVRLLPAYKLFRDIISSGQIKAFTLTHRLRSFMDPFTYSEHADMQQFMFMPIESSCSRISVSVSYRSSFSDLCPEPSTTMSPQFIPDYVGSPLAEPLKRFPSLPVSQSAPSFSPIMRQHSLNFGIFHNSPRADFPSPFPTYPDSPTPVSRTQHPPPSSVPSLLPEAFYAKYQNVGLNEKCPSPTFPTSTSMSSTDRIPRGNPPKALIRCESAPISISSAKQLITLGSPLKQSLPPPSPVRQTRHGNVKNEKSSGTSGSVAEKISNLRDESGRLSGERLSSNSSPRVSFSRSSSRLEFDDTEFACPFVVDEDDMIDDGGRTGSRYEDEPYEAGSGLSLPRKSQGAAVGALVLMLNKAPPLHKDLICSSTDLFPEGSSNTTEDSHFEKELVQHAGSSSGDFSTRQLMSKTAALALEELRGHRKMKESLLKQGIWSQHGAEAPSDSGKS